jgi:hypothetical protein
MRLNPLVAAALLLLSGPAAAQGWSEYTSQDDLFIVYFPGEPTVTTITYPTEYGITLPARVYSVEGRGSRYSVTVVDYTTAEQLHTERARNCQGYPDTCTNRTANDLRGALRIFDKDMARVRYQTIYRHGYAPPPREPSPPGGRLRGC